MSVRTLYAGRIPGCPKIPTLPNTPLKGVTSYEITLISYLVSYTGTWYMILRIHILYVCIYSYHTYIPDIVYKSSRFIVINSTWIMILCTWYHTMYSTGCQMRFKMYQVHLKYCEIFRYCTPYGRGYLCGPPPPPAPPLLNCTAVSQNCIHWVAEHRSDGICYGAPHMHGWLGCTFAQ